MSNLMPSLRERVFIRDDFRCAHCGNCFERLTLHHIRPRCLGGTDALSNLISLCGPCHASLNSSMLAFANYAMWFYSLWHFRYVRKHS